MLHPYFSRKQRRRTCGKLLHSVALLFTYWHVPKLLVATAQQQQEAYPDAPPPDNRYYIGIPTFSSSNLQVSLDYPVANLAPFEYFRVQIFDGSSCPNDDVGETNNDITNEPYMQTELSPIDDFGVEGDGSQYRRLKLDIAFDPETIRDSSILTENGLEAQLGFCVQLQTLSAEAVNPGAASLFLRETYITIDIDQNGGIAVEGVVDVPEGDEGEEYYLVGYICDLENQEIVDPQPIYLGQAIRVCVTPNEVARNNDVYMQAIEQFAWTRDSIHQQAISPMQEAAHLTTIECEPGMLICAFTTFLSMPFFYKLGYANGAGSGWLRFGRGDYTGNQRRAQIKLLGYLGALPQNEVGNELENRHLAADFGPESEGYAGGGQFAVEHPLTRLYIAIGFLCDLDNIEVDYRDYPISKGMKARVCIRPDGLALFQDNVRIRSIDRFVWERQDLNVSQVAITTNSQAAPQTEIFCERGSQVCAFETALNDSFFQSTGIAEGRGIVWLQFGQDSRRAEELGQEYGAEYELGFYILPQMEPGFAGASPFDAKVALLPPKESRELYECKVYECEGDENIEIIPGVPVEQNSSIRMCVEPSTYAKMAGANMWMIEWWEWKRKNITQPAIVKQGQEAPDGMTVQSCHRGAPICIFETRLQNDFFTHPGAMTGEGFCWLTFGKGHIVQGSIEREDPDAEQEEIDPSKDALYAGSNPIDYEFPVTGDYKYVLVCPEEDHQLDIWWNQMPPIQRTLIWLSIFVSIGSCCCLAACCFLSAWRDRDREEIETSNGKVVVNVDLSETNTNQKTNHTSDGLQGNEQFNGKPTDGDILLGEDSHPGTKKFIRAITTYMKNNRGVSYGPAAYGDVMGMLPNHVLILNRNSDRDGWRIATKHEIISYMGEVWKREMMQSQ